jgi:RimJ/RimL family protein N-acetyltransferase/mannose-6-phosphate isomerase-like protein (cupin superfamily)
MLIKGDQARAFEVHGLQVRDYGAVAEGGASVAVVDVPPKGGHPYAYSSASDKIFVMIEGALRFDVDGIAYTARAGDVVVVPKEKLFQYFDWQGQTARVLVIHAPTTDETAEHVVPNVLRTHYAHLTGERVKLRPMTEDDWEHVCAWNADPEVLSWADEPGTPPRQPEEAKEMYRGISLFAHIFIIEFEGEPIGECWLQKLNLPEIRDRFPGRDLRRIDIAIGRKDLWGKGLGTDAIRTLVRFAFDQERADGIYSNVSRANPRSWRAFEKAGFRPLEAAEGLIIWR